jgi:hypothetical protein
MADKKIELGPDDWVPDGFMAYADLEQRIHRMAMHVHKVLDDVRERLTAGAEGPGATLTADECVKVLGCLKNPPNPNSRPRRDGFLAASMAYYCRNLEKGGASPKSAIEKTMQHWECKRSTVYAALKTYPSK